MGRTAEFVGRAVWAGESHRQRRVSLEIHGFGNFRCIFNVIGACCGKSSMEGMGLVECEPCPELRVE